MKKKMPLEYKKFEAVDRNYRSIMLSFSTEPIIWENIDNDKMKNEFDQSNKQLEVI